MEDNKKLPKSLYDVVSQLVTFIDDADYKRKEEKIEERKKYINTIQKTKQIP